MPYSSHDGKKELFAHVAKLGRHKTILDVGPGAGYIGRNLKEMGFTNVDAIEIHEPYIDQFQLRKIYRTVIHGDIVQAHFLDNYGLMIFGDILEHIPEKTAVELVEKLKFIGQKAVFSVPWNYQQGALDGVESEIHHQPDLTKEKCDALYKPEKWLYIGNVIGVFTI